MSEESEAQKVSSDGILGDGGCLGISLAIVALCWAFSGFPGLCG